MMLNADRRLIHVQKYEHTLVVYHPFLPYRKSLEIHFRSMFVYFGKCTHLRAYFTDQLWTFQVLFFLYLWPDKRLVQDRSSRFFYGQHPVFNADKKQMTIIRSLYTVTQSLWLFNDITLIIAMIGHVYLSSVLSINIAFSNARNTFYNFQVLV